ncbi:MAG TPA: FHA domain-containing protein [Thermoanaerobaculia bacterium]|nr:FHA domain-containing protein [Thermoanaerobaculia bacterium]
MLRTRRDEMQTADYGISTASYAEVPPPPEQIIEGKTIKLHAPPPNTVKLLPGWFDVVGGDDVVKQIRFYSLGGERGTETTFGRVAGRPYAHIQLKAPTVSSRQAKVAFDNGAAQLTNLASSDSNPTKVNGREMGVNESVPLCESDRVEMGEVSLLFHSSSTLTKTAIV